MEPQQQVDVSVLLVTNPNDGVFNTDNVQEKHLKVPPNI